MFSEGPLNNVKHTYTLTVSHTHFLYAENFTSEVGRNALLRGVGRYSLKGAKAVNIQKN